MEGLLLIEIAVAALVIINTLTGKIKELHFHFEALNRELQKLRQEMETVRRQPAAPAAPIEKPAAPEVKIFMPQPVVIPKPEITLKPEPAIPLSAPEPVKTVGQEPEKVQQPSEKIAPEPVYYEPEPGFTERFLKNNPDLEKFIGENLINKIGIAILVLGIGYFVKFAIDKDWINEIGRVFIGILAGGLLIGIAHRLRNTFNAFSSVLVGGGLAVLYFTIAIAFHEYALFGQVPAFLIMVVITGFSVLLSVSYNRVELAVLAILGGFATPFMVSTGEGNYVVLFVYVLTLNAGMLVLAYVKGWKIINWICYGFTVILFGGWLGSRVLNTLDGPYLGALIFATLFYITFFLMNIIYNVKDRVPFTGTDIGILLSNTFLYYSAGMSVLYQINNGLYQGLFTVGVAVFNFLFAYVLFKHRQADRNLVYLLIGLVITFISLAIPVQLEGNYITMFWALEAVLLLWFAQKAGIRLAFISALVVTGLMLISLIMDWDAIYMNFAAGRNLMVLLNKGFITSLVAFLSLVASGWLLQRDTEPVPFGRYEVEPLQVRKAIGYMAGMLLYLMLILELNFQLNTYLGPGITKTLILGSYNLAFISGLLLYSRYRQKPSLILLAAGIGAFGVLLYAFLYNTAVYQLVQHQFLSGAVGQTGFMFHYLNLGLVIFIITVIFRNRSVFEKYSGSAEKVTLWVLSLLIVFIASSELLYHVVYFSVPESGTNNYEMFGNLKNQVFKVGFPILWGICAFTLMYLGLKQKNKHLRIISLTLFGLTLVKLFLFDIRGISEGGKIAAFICLGVLLLIISFMYQNIKKLILSDENPQEAEV